MDQPSKQEDNEDEFPALSIFVKRYRSLAFSIGGVILVLIAVLVFGTLLLGDTSVNLHFTGWFAIVGVVVVLFFAFLAFVLWTFFKKAWEESDPNRKKPKPEEVKEKEKSREKEKQPSHSREKSSFLIWFWRLLKLNLWILVIGAFFYYLPGVVREIRSGQISFSPSQTPIVIPTVCRDSWSREARGLGNHFDQVGIDHFDVDPTPGCFEEWIRPPRDWSRWDYEFMDGGDQCRIWFWMYGSERPLGPYTPHNLPTLPIGPPTKWRVSTNCTFRYFQLR